MNNEEIKVVSRRQAIRTIGHGMLYTMALPLIPIPLFLNNLFSKPNSRQFHFPKLDSLIETGFSVLAFEVAQKSADHFLIKFLDAKCQRCGEVVRIAGSLIEANMKAYRSVECRTCSVKSQLAKKETDLLVSQLLNYGFTHAIGLHSSVKKKIAGSSSTGGYVHRIEPSSVKEAPSSNHSTPLSIVETAVCRDIRNHQPVGIYSRHIKGIPSSLVYFTEVNGIGAHTKINHIYVCNGIVMDKIALKLKSLGHFRTYSAKSSLKAGNWIIFAQTPDGDVLACDYFRIID